MYKIEPEVQVTSGPLKVTIDRSGTDAMVILEVSLYLQKADHYELVGFKKLRKTTQKFESTPEFALMAGAKYHVWLNYLVIEGELGGEYEFVSNFDANGAITTVLSDKGDVDALPGQDTYRPPMIPIINLSVL